MSWVQLERCYNRDTSDAKLDVMAFNSTTSEKIWNLHTWPPMNSETGRPFTISEDGKCDSRPHLLTLPSTMDVSNDMYIYGLLNRDKVISQLVRIVTKCFGSLTAECIGDDAVLVKFECSPIGTIPDYIWRRDNVTKK